MNDNIRHYELMCIISTRIPEKEIELKKNNIKKKIEKISTKITAFIDIGIMNLAYKIKSHLKGYYFVITFNADSSVIPDLKTELNLDTDLLRFLLIKIPDNHILPSDMKIIGINDLLSKSDEQKDNKGNKVKKVRKKVAEKKSKEKTEKSKSKKDLKEDEILSNKNNKKKSSTIKHDESNDNYTSDKINDLSKKIDDLLNSI